MTREVLKSIVQRVRIIYNHVKKRSWNRIAKLRIKLAVAFKGSISAACPLPSSLK